MKIKTKIGLVIASLAMLAAVPAAAGIGHSWFMRGSIVAEDATGKVVCIGSDDGATVGQVLVAYRVVPNPGPSKGTGPNFRRERTGQVRIDHIFDAHFAHVTVVEGTPTVHDIVELRRTRRR